LIKGKKMAKQKQKEKEKVNKDKKYNKTGRESLFRVEITTADTEEEAKEMRQMKKDIVAHSGSAKHGSVAMYRFAKENGFFDKKDL